MTRYGYDATGHEFRPETVDAIRERWERTKTLWGGAFRTPGDVIVFVDGILLPVCTCGGTQADARHDLRDDEPIATLESIGL